jgi:predicted HTH domain antitoxin
VNSRDDAAYRITLAKSYLSRAESDAVGLEKARRAVALAEAIYARMTPEELRRELAIHLFQQGKLSLGKAREMAEMSAWAFQLMLGSRMIPVHYGMAEYEEDLKTLKDLGQR